jgi:EmrB/QacA subfamily drug resistance transporter
MSTTTAEARLAVAPVLTREILSVAAVVVLGAIMTILDATITNVALPTLGRDFHSSIATIQWVPTAYMLAFASVIPLTGWASERFGAKPLWLASLVTFMVGSLLAGLSWSIGALIAFRILQGVGGGMIMPLGQTILAQRAGPQRMGRVMSLVGVPMLLAPIAGPVIGGALIDAASWRWIFFVNLPVGLLALALALRRLPSVPPSGRQRLDSVGLVLLSGGIATFVYGLAEVGQKGTLAATTPLVALGAGALLVALFALHALRAEAPLIDVRLFARRGFGAAAATNLVLGVALFGVALLLPLYFQILRGRSPLDTGLLLIPQGLGAACAISVAGSLTDKVGARRVVPAGILLALAGTAAYTQISARSSYAYLAAALFLIGVGLGATITPSMAAAYQDLQRAEIPRASGALNAVQRIAGALGSALLAVVLQRAIDAELPHLRGGIGQASALVGHDPLHAAPAIANAFGTTFWVAFALTAAALIPALLLPPKRAEQLGPEEMTTTSERSTMSNANRPVQQSIAILIGLEASTFAIMSVLHLTGTLAGDTSPFNRTDAGIAEAVICVVLIGGAAALAGHSAHGRAVALGALGFAILGVIVGLNFTIQGGDAIDIAYHATLLPLLLGTLAVLWRGPSARPQAPPAPSRT